MSNYTQKYMALVMAPWLSEPQVQFATFTFDDATPAQFPTWATVREELARRSAFKDTDATDTNDKWATSGKDAGLKSIEVAKFDVLYLAEFNQYQSLGGVSPPNLAKTTDYVWPAVGTSGLAANLAGLTTLTVDGDDVLSGNITTTDATPPVVASITDAAQASGAAKAVQEGDQLVAVLNGAEIYAQTFVDGSGVDEVAAADLSGVSSNDVYTLDFFIRKANGATSRKLTRTLTKS